LVQARAMDLLKIVGLAFNGSGCECGCKEYGPGASFTQWGPTDPFGPDPGYIPPHYRFPAWYVAGSTIIPGVQAGDVVTDILHGPFGEGIPGIPQVPYFRINVNGMGKVEITFVRFPSAGLALIVVDGNITTARYVDLHTSLSASVGSVDTSMIIPVDIGTPGDHTIDVSMVFTVTESPPYAHFGGAIRAISLCGFESEEPPTFTIGDDDVELRQEGCLLQAKCIDGSWVTIYDPTSCISGGSIGAVTQPPPGGTLSAGQCKDYDVTLSGNNQWVLPVPVTDGCIITVTAATGGWNDGSGSLGWYCPDGNSYLLGACVSGQHHVGGDPSSTLYHGQLMIVVDGTYYDPFAGAVTLSGVSGAQPLTLQMNDASLSDNAGSIQFHVNVCAGDTVIKSRTFDFTESDGGFIFEVTSCPGDSGVYVPGVGYQPTCCGTYFGIDLLRYFDETVELVEFDITYTKSAGTFGLSAPDSITAVTAGPVYHTLSTAPSNSAVVPGWSGSYPSTIGIRLALTASVGADVCISDGTITLTSITIKWIGPDIP